MTALVDSRPLTEAVRAAVETALGAWQVYDYGQVPGADNNAGPMPAIYGLLSVERTPGSERRMSGQHNVSGWRIVVRVVGTTVNETRWALNKVAVALNETTLNVGTRSTTPIQFERDQAPELDEGRFSALSSWTTTH